jgi:hypothetical protein
MMPRISYGKRRAQWVKAETNGGGLGENTIFAADPLARKKDATRMRAKRIKKMKN